MAVALFLLSQEATQAAGFSMTYLPTANREEAAVQNLLKHSGRFERVVAALNRQFRLPHGVRVRLGGKEGPQYDPKSATIDFPYAFLVDTRSHFKDFENPPTPREADDLLLDVGEFALYHEVGHAVVDLLNVPVAGRLEDAVDGLATLLALREPHGDRIALAAADDFALLSDEEAPGDANLWDEHALDAQRYYQIVCWVAGSDPKRLGDVAAEAGIGADRAAGCADEYRRLRRSWDAYLKTRSKH